MKKMLQVNDDYILYIKDSIFFDTEERISIDFFTAKRLLNIKKKTRSDVKKVDVNNLCNLLGAKKVYTPYSVKIHGDINLQYPAYAAKTHQAYGADYSFKINAQKPVKNSDYFISATSISHRMNLDVLNIKLSIRIRRKLNSKQDSYRYLIMGVCGKDDMDYSTNLFIGSDGNNNPYSHPPIKPGGFVDITFEEFYLPKWQKFDKLDYIIARLF
jgi:hypothetical protein